MIQKRRLDTIMGILKDEGMVDVKTLSQRRVTEKTVRLDLKELENQNLVERVHGSCSANPGLETITRNIEILPKVIPSGQKQRIARRH